MLLKAVEVRCFRTIQSVRVTFASGLNVIHGDNDVGKTTLMAAIRACLTERAVCTGKRLAAMRPRTGGEPKVEVSFLKDGVLYSVAKQFGPRGTAHLNVRPQEGVASDYRGEDAEHELRLALGLTEEASRRSPDLGILPLLWVEQGTSRDLPAPQGTGANALAERLQGLSGEAIGGEGSEALFRAIDGQFEQTYSSRGARAGSALQSANDTVAGAELECATLERRRTELERSVASFEDKSLRLQSVRAKKPTLLSAYLEAKALESSVREGQVALAGAQTDVKGADGEAKAAAEQVTRRATERAALEDALARASLLRDAESAAQKRLEEAAQPRAEVEARAEAATAAEGVARAEVAIAQQAVTRIEQAQQLATIEKRLADCRAQELVRDAAQKAARAESIDARELRSLEQLASDSDLAQAALGSSSTRIVLRSAQCADVALGGEITRIEPGQNLERIVSSSTTVAFAGLELEVCPGGEDLPRLRSQAKAAQQAFHAALGRLAASDLFEARVRAATRDGALRNAEVASAHLASLAPEGMAALEAQQAELRLSAGTGGEDVSLQALLAARKRFDASFPALDAAAQTAKDARAALTQVEAHLARATSDVRLAHQTLTAAVGTLERFQAALEASMVAFGSDDDLARRHAEAMSVLSTCQTKRDALRSRLPATSHSEATDRLERAKRALDDASEEEQRLGTDCHRLEVDLQAPDLMGFDDRMAEAAAQRERAIAEQLRAREHGEALTLLRTMLHNEREDARKRFLAPLSREIQPLLELLFPRSGITLDASFAVTQIERTFDGTHDVDDLGGGSQEQLSIVTRLAMARVLGNGGPMPVMLDDAIVYSSEPRFARMVDVLRMAARDLQVLIFTCHWDKYRALGAENVVDLAEAKALGGVARAA